MARLTSENSGRGKAGGDVRMLTGSRYQLKILKSQDFGRQGEDLERHVTFVKNAKPHSSTGHLRKFIESICFTPCQLLP